MELISLVKSNLETSFSLIKEIILIFFPKKKKKNLFSARTAKALRNQQFPKSPCSISVAVKPFSPITQTCF